MNGVGAVVIFGVADKVARTGGIGLFIGLGGGYGKAIFARHVADDEGFETLFRGVCVHSVGSLVSGRWRLRISGTKGR